MDADEYMQWMKYREFKRATESPEEAEIEIVEAKIDDAGLVANIKFLWEKERAANYGAEQMFDKARNHHHEIWMRIAAALPEHFQDVEEDENGVKHLSKGKIYNHEENTLRYVLMKRVKRTPLTRTSESPDEKGTFSIDLESQAGTADTVKDDDEE